MIMRDRYGNERNVPTSGIAIDEIARKELKAVWEKMNDLEEKLDAIINYLDIEVEKPDHYQVSKRIPRKPRIAEY